MNPLKLITTDVPDYNEVIYLEQQEGEDPVLVYKKMTGEIVRLNKGGSPGSRLLNCSLLNEILTRYFLNGTKFINSTYNPILYTLFPGDNTYDRESNPSNKFIPILGVYRLSRNEVDGFNTDGVSGITQDDVKSIKSCDNWYNNPTEMNEAIEKIDERISDIFGVYKGFNILSPEEVNEVVEKSLNHMFGSYSADFSEQSLVVCLTSDTTYTDTINLEDWIYGSGKGNDEIEAKLDISFMYSIEGKMYSGMQTISAYRYSGGSLVVPNTILDLGKVQIEFFGGTLKIYPKDQTIDEIIINDCILTIGSTSYE